MVSMAGRFIDQYEKQNNKWFFKILKLVNFYLKANKLSINQ